jgi:membrane-associated phospholipid phosphatase
MRKIILLIWGVWPLLAVGQASWERDWLHRVADNRTIAKNRFYHTWSDMNAPMTLGIPAGWLAVGLIRKDSKQTQAGIRWVAAQLVNGGSTYFLKAIVNRPRPAESDPTLIALEKSPTPAFPSGHTSSAFALATSVSLDHPKWFVIAPAYLYASLVGYSRCYLGVHYPSDVIAGALLGSASAWATQKAEKWIRATGTKKPSKKQLAYQY